MAVVGNKQGLRRELLEKLESLSSRLGADVHIVSGLRPGHVDKSAHNSGIAADVSVDGMLSIELANELVREGFSGVGEYYSEDGAEEVFAHADIRGLPGSELSGLYAQGKSKAEPLGWYRDGVDEDDYKWGVRKSGGPLPSPRR